MLKLAFSVLVGSVLAAAPDATRDSVWYALPAGFDQSKPDSILELLPSLPLWFDGMYLFGDSDCDTGNLFKLTKGTDPDPNAYWKGRFSNGPMWPDYLQARHRLKVRNYAYGGAVVNRKNAIVLDVPDFFQQIETHRQAGPLGGKPLAIVQFVGNDLLNKTVSSAQLARDIGNSIQKLINQGEIKDVIVMLSPIIAYEKQGLNQALLDMVKSLAAVNQGKQIRTLEMLSIYTGMASVAPVTADPSIWRNTDDYCYNRNARKACSDPENHFRFDMFHPSTVPNYNVAMYVSDAIARLWPL